MSRPQRFRLALVLLAVTLAVRAALAHDIPNARVDRSIQVDLSPRLVQIEYEVGLAELTLTQDLRSLIGQLPGADRATWFQRYGEVTGPLNAKGLIVRVEQAAIPLRFQSFRLVVEEHPRFFFRFEAPIPESGRLLVQDTNYAGSEGTSRLAIRGNPGLRVEGDDLPTDVSQIVIRPVWQLSNEEEQRTRQVIVRYKEQLTDSAPTVRPTPVQPPAQPNPAPPSPIPGNRLTRLLDDPGRGPIAWILMALTAMGLGALHSLQPGHGKTLSMAGTAGSHHPWRSALILGISTTVAHLGTVLSIALILYGSGASRFEAIHQPLAQTAGFVIAATGLWRMGRELGRHSSAVRINTPVETQCTDASLVGLGLAAGLVPCWEGIALIVIAASIGQLALGVFVIGFFSLGLGLVLVLVAGLTSQLGGRLENSTRRAAPVIRLLGAAVLVVIGLWFLVG